MGRRAEHADSRDVRERKYKPPIAPERFVFALSYIVAGRLGGPSNGLVTFVFFVTLVVQTPYVSVPPCLRVNPCPPSSPLPRILARDHDFG